MERHLLVGNRGIIVGKAHISDIHPGPSVKALEIIITECPGNLSGPVRTEIKENNGIPLLNRGNRLSVFHRQSRLYKLIGLSPVVGFLNSADSAGGGQSFSLCHGIISQLHTIPVVISVHHIITPHDGSNPAHAELLHLCAQSLCILLSAGRRGIPSIQEAMHIYLFQAVPFCQLQQTVQMSIVAMHAAVG